MNKQLVPGILLSILAFASCSKSVRTTVDPVTPDSTTAGYTYSMSSIYNSLKNMPRTIVFNTATGGSFYGNSGTKYTFPANAFQTVSGGLVTGTIQLDVTEYVKRGDMIFSRVLPVSNGEPLVSGGEILVTATQGSTRLMLKPGITYTADVPQLGAISTGMQFFYGRTVNTSVNPVNWTDTFTTHGGGYTVYKGDTISIVSDSTGYSSAGRYLSSPNYQSFTLTINGATFDDSDHVQGYALFNNSRVVYPLAARYHQRFTETHVPNVPLHFVVYTVYHGDFYGAISSSMTPLTGNTYDLELIKVNPITFLAQVNAL